MYSILYALPFWTPRSNTPRNQRYIQSITHKMCPHILIVVAMQCHSVPVNVLSCRLLSLVHPELREDGPVQEQCSSAANQPAQIDQQIVHIFILPFSTVTSHDINTAVLIGLEQSNSTWAQPHRLEMLANLFARGCVRQNRQYVC